MGLFDFLKRKKKSPKDLARPAPSAYGPKAKAAEGFGQGRVNPSYHRIHSWIESRIGPMKDIPGPEQKDRLMELLEDERAAGDGGLQSDPQAGLQAYIATNAYRKMLE